MDIFVTATAESAGLSRKVKTFCKFIQQEVKKAGLLLDLKRTLTCIIIA